MFYLRMGLYALGPTFAKLEGNRATMIACTILQHNPPMNVRLGVEHGFLEFREPGRERRS